jgi:hypothetical protein
MAYSSGRDYPNGAFILSLIGGIFILLGALAFAALAAIGASFLAFFPAAAALLIAYAVLGLILGIIVIVGAVMMRSRPEQAKMWGVIVIVLAFIALFTSGGGFILGFLLALIGGILALVWHPRAPMPMGQPGWGQPGMAPPPGFPPMQSAPAAGQRFCASCGSPNPAGVQFCSKCGAALPAQ